MAVLKDKDLCEAIEADFARYYRLPISPGRRYTWRRFGVLMRGLPPESLFARTMARRLPDTGQPDMSSWPLAERLLGTIAEILLAANWQRGGGKGPRPQLFGSGKPTLRKHRPPVMGPADARAILARNSGKGLTDG